MNPRSCQPRDRHGSRTRRSVTYAPFWNPTGVASGRFAAPAGRYFPGLLGAPVDEADLVSCARAEGGRGARWVKVIADFPGKAAGTGAEANYPIGSIAQLVAALYQAGARVAVHSTISDAGHLVAAGVDSIEHGIGLGASASANSSAATSSARSVSPKTRTRPPASGSSRRPSSRPSRPPRRLRPDAPRTTRRRHTPQQAFSGKLAGEQLVSGIDYYCNGTCRIPTA
jgi:hypothetical protein